MICTGMPAVPISMQQWLEFYNSVYRLNYDLYRIWWGPAFDIYLGAVGEYQNSTNAD
jgi:hypothetical protein